MVLVKKWPFLPVLFLGNIGQENMFYDIVELKNAFLGLKKKSWKSRKIEIFPKRLTHGFDQKMAISPCSFFRQYRTRKCVLRYCRTKKRLSRLAKEKLKQSKNWDFSKEVNPWFWSKSGHFSTFFFQAI